MCIRNRVLKRVVCYCFMIFLCQFVKIGGHCLKYFEKYRTLKTGIPSFWIIYHHDNPNLVVPEYTNRRDVLMWHFKQITILFRSNRENSPENPNYKIDEDEGIKQFKILDKIGEGTYGQVNPFVLCSFNWRSKLCYERTNIMVFKLVEIVFVDYTTYGQLLELNLSWSELVVKSCLQVW